MACEIHANVRPGVAAASSRYGVTRMSRVYLRYPWASNGGLRTSVPYRSVTGGQRESGAEAKLSVGFGGDVLEQTRMDASAHPLGPRLVQLADVERRHGVEQHAEGEK